MSSTTAPSTVQVVELVRGWDAVEFWVGNARSSAQFFSSVCGFTVTGYAGPETGVADRASYVLEQGAIRFVVTAALRPDSPIGDAVSRHGDGVHELAWDVVDADAAFDAALFLGALPVHPPTQTSDEFGVLVRAAVMGYGDTVHSFVDRRHYDGLYAPGYRADNLPPTPAGDRVRLSTIDHVVGNVEPGDLQRWSRFYEDVFGFRELLHYSEEQIRTDYSALRSTVVWNGDKIVMPLNEPADGRRRSQIQEFLDAYGGAGVQHIALGTADLFATVRALRARGMRFLATPPAYYDDIRRRLAHLQLPWDLLAELGILVDEDAEGYLLQIFSENLGDRPTVFLEIIQRAGCRGFGEGNFKALFEAIEREQERRGNL